MKKTLILTLLLLLAGVTLQAQMPRTDMERLAYQVNDRISDAEIRNLSILATR